MMIADRARWKSLLRGIGASARRHAWLADPRCNQGRQLAGGPRLADEIALRLGATFQAQAIKLLLRFDAFRSGWNTQAAAKADHRADDRQAVLPVVEVVYEGSIDLDLVEGEAAKITDR